MKETINWSLKYFFFLFLINLLDSLNVFNKSLFSSLTIFTDHCLIIFHDFSFHFTFVFNNALYLTNFKMASTLIIIIVWAFMVITFLSTNDSRMFKMFYAVFTIDHKLRFLFVATSLMTTSYIMLFIIILAELLY